MITQLTRKLVLWAYGRMLERDPESAHIVVEKMNALGSAKDVRNEQLQSLDPEQKKLDTAYEQAVWAYRILLDREPESEQVVVDTANTYSTAAEIRREIMTSSEFRQKNPEMNYINDRNIVIKEIDERIRLFVDLSDYVIGLGIILGDYEKSEISFVRRIVKPGQNAIDIGGNIGYYTVILASLIGDCGKVYTFEPLARNADLIERSVAENDFGGRVHLERAAVGDENGEIDIISPLKTTNLGGAYLNKQNANIPAGHIVDRVRTIRLDEYNQLKRPISFIKIDIEGAEPLAFAGAKKILSEDKPVILSEINVHQLKTVSNCTPNDLIEQMGSYGFKCYELEDGAIGSHLHEYAREEMISVVFLTDDNLNQL